MNSLFKAIGLASIANAIQLTATNQLDAEVEAFAVPASAFDLSNWKLQVPYSSTGSFTTGYATEITSQHSLLSPTTIFSTWAQWLMVPAQLFCALQFKVLQPPAQSIPELNSERWLAPALSVLPGDQMTARPIPWIYLRLWLIWLQFQHKRPSSKFSTTLTVLSLRPFSQPPRVSTSTCLHRMVTPTQPTTSTRLQRLAPSTLFRS